MAVARSWRIACMWMCGAITMTAQPQRISWTNNFDTALTRARNEQRTVLLDFSAAPM